MNTFKKFFYLLSAKEKKQGYLLLVMIIIMALLEMIGVASILPFTATLADPNIIDTNFFLSNLFNYSTTLGVESKKQFIFILGLLVFLLLVATICFKAFTNYLQLEFTNMREYSVSKKLVENYLHQPYSWFLNKHSADLGKSILSEVGLVIGHGLRPLMELIAKSFVAITIIILLILVDPKIAFVAGLILGIAYLIVYKFTRNYLIKIGKDRAKANELRFSAVNEAFGASKEIKLGGLEEYYIKSFSEPAKIYSKNLAIASIISGLPRYVLEAIIFGGMLLIILFLLDEFGSFVNLIPIISLYAVACYRLIPALQAVYASTAQLRFISPALDSVYKDFKTLEKKVLAKNNNILPLNKNIVLKKIYYTYPNASKAVLKNINISIPVNNTIGLVGATGSGKTTLVDIILGLLEPQKGTLEIDGTIIKRLNSRVWQQSIGYVPQQIYLSDDSIKANIAFGVEDKDINIQAVEKASKIANLHNFVVKELPKKYKTKIGERGVRLSGGQRQRIGIARALYHNPKVLILDEATSALDNQTEKAVMDAVNNIGKNITIILIAHRLNTIKKCDKVYVIEKGQLKDEGTFEELSKINKNFSTNINNF
jgi:ATP-binding cassette, subfamily B, bacterial PglK